MVSVIVPNYNHSCFLQERIESILNQTFQDYEIIFLDDCSTDNSLDIINCYKGHPKVSQIVLSELNSGSPFKQWEKGIELAQGDIVWIAESDDTCEPTFLETLVRAYQENKAVLAFCRSQRIDENGTVLDNHFQDVFTNDFVMKGDAFLRQYITHNSYIQNISSAIFSKEVASTLAHDYINFKGAGDWMFAIELSQKGNVVFVNTELNHYRVHSHNTTNNEQKNGNGAKEVKLIYDYFLQQGIINNKQYQWHRKDRLRQIHFGGYSNDIRNKLLKMWRVNRIERCWLMLLTIYNQLLIFKRRLTG